MYVKCDVAVIFLVALSTRVFLPVNGHPQSQSCFRPPPHVPFPRDSPLSPGLPLLQLFSASSLSLPVAPFLIGRHATASVPLYHRSFDYACLLPFRKAESNDRARDRWQGSRDRGAEAGSRILIRYNEVIGMGDSS
jgi:hypothetical protein